MNLPTSVAAGVSPRCLAPLAADGPRRRTSAATRFMARVQFNKTLAALE